MVNAIAVHTHGDCPEGSPCPYCKKRRLWSHAERENGICNSCVDRQYERHQERKEWEYYHHD